MNDIYSHIHKLSGEVQVSLGKIKGQTLLSLPPNPNPGGAEEPPSLAANMRQLLSRAGVLSPASPTPATPQVANKDVLHQLESCVIEWSWQIKSITEKQCSPQYAAGQNPGPLAEVEFWQQQAANLKAVYAQLSGENFQKVARILEIARNSYFPAFKKMVQEVIAALNEANDNARFLEALRPRIEKFGADQAAAFPELPKEYQPTMQVILLIYLRSRYLNTPKFLTTILREFCNDLIELARAYLGADSIFKGEVPDSIRRLQIAIGVVEQFTTVYDEFKAAVDRDHPAQCWRVERDHIFARVFRFRDRLKNIVEVLRSFVSLVKLEKGEVGGPKGEDLTRQVGVVYTEFMAAMDSFLTASYDCLNPEDPKFDEAYKQYVQERRDWSHRLGSLVSQGFETALTIPSPFKLLDTFDEVILREDRHTDLEKHFQRLLGQYLVELRFVEHEFYQYHKDPPLYLNLPPLAGALWWSRGLADRLITGMASFEQHTKSMLDHGLGLEIVKYHTHVMGMLAQYQRQQFDEWAAKIDTASLDKLELPLLRRLPAVPPQTVGQLAVNFNPALVALLREVKYLRMLEGDVLKVIGADIPGNAMTIFEQAETFRNYTGTLDLVVEHYNTSIQTMLPEEAPLVQDRMNAANEALEEGINHLNWKQSGVGAFIAKVQQMVDAIFNRLQQAQKSVNEIENVLKSWATPILRRAAEDRKLINPVEERDKYAVRLAEVQRGGEAIHQRIAENNATFDGIAPDSPSWKAYLRYISRIVAEGISAVVKVSLQYLIQHMEVAQKDPLFEVRLQLQKQAPVSITAAPTQKGQERPAFRLAYVPDTEGVDEGSLSHLVNTWVKNFFEIAQAVRCVECDGNYLQQMQQHAELVLLRQQVRQLLDDSLMKCNELSAQFSQYDFLWKSELEATFKKFLTSGPQVLPHLRELLPEIAAEMTSTVAAPAAPAEGLEAQERAEAERKKAEEKKKADAAKKKDDKGGEKKDGAAPTLEDFEREIRLLMKLRQKVELIPDQIRHTWLRADARAGKADIIKMIDEWIKKYQTHLETKVTSSLADLQQFIERVSSELTRKFTPETLYEALHVLLDLRARTEATDEMFEPLRAVCALLKRFGIHVSPDALNLLDTLPPLWDRVKRLSYTLKDSLQQMMYEEKQNIHARYEAFQHRVDEYREKFRGLPYFNFTLGPTDAYALIDQVHQELNELEEEAKKIAASEDLFELTVHEYDGIAACRADLLVVKSVWDVAQLVLTQFAVWKGTPWQEIDTSSIEEQCKEFTKEVRTLKKNAGAWDVYNGLEATVRAFGASMPLVSDLRHPAMRPHHWKQLTEVCKVSFTITADFKLSDLLDLNLHKYADDVSEIVEKAQKEQAIEKVLRDVTNNWASITLLFGEHKKTGTPVLGELEETITQLETDQVQLSNAMSQRFVALFLDDLTSLQQKLTVVDSVLTIWVEVQRAWAHLETIFIGSADIRAQLPQDSARFDQIDADWKQMMAEAVTVPNAVQCCNREGLLQRLQELQKLLSLCEKSLSSYLETKRRCFPRFYFLSSVDLLDILSRGANPHDVMVHLPKLFDAIKTLRFEKVDGVETDVAIGMISKEDEYVPFNRPWHLKGKVEVWLDDVVKAMRETLQNILQEAVQAYEEKPRDVFIFEFPAQIALVAGQIYWNTEVQNAFESLEEGNENALKDYNKKQQQQLNVLVQRIQKPLERNDRQKIMTIVTIDVHARDVITNLIRDKVDSALCFGWVSQLRLGWNEEDLQCYAKICDATFRYWYEFLGNTSRLVITPLTDRCYITLTQSLHLTMGGAPAGPAGTGKTETVKDLGRALAQMVYVFNCSEQMDFRSLGAIFKGLAQSGAWGCFDEFNRISIEVLSVVATQVKCILDAIRAKKTQFNFCDDGADITLERTCGLFITMNPGYAGRTELPENLKALFRPVSMVVPDFLLICEIMLMAEGFLEAKELAKKFTTLYSLNKELLSKQDHYDWGLRAIKSVLVVAGTLKRADPDLPEDDILMRALRDFNKPKIITEDMDVFMGLITDLFPKKNPVRKVDPVLESTIARVTKESKLQPEDKFVLKVVQLQELLAVRHSVFIIGPPGSAKTQVWRMLAKANGAMGKPTLTKDLNPKAVRAHELFGYTNAQKETKDGLFSSIMRDLAGMKDTDPKWIILDGDIDPGWIESLNTVMDDNKVLTLASNERIPLYSHMRLLFEIGNLTQASPATVSRAGILFINETDVGWGPFVISWIDTREGDSLRNNLTVLFDKYVIPTLSFIKKNLKFFTPMYDFNLVQTLCYMLETLLTPKVCAMEKEVLEMYFVFACIWAFGGALMIDQIRDYRQEFSRWWRSEMKQVKLPDPGSVFDYCIDPAQNKFVPWTLPTYEHVPDRPIPTVLVPTVETTRLMFWMHQLMANRRPVLLLGGAGCGKTMIVKEHLARLGDKYMYSNINYNYYTDAKNLQFIMEQPLTKIGKQFAPPGNKRLVFFIDDLNMPEVDIYGTQSPNTLLRQHIDYGHFYDRQKLTLKDVVNCQYVACMNPTTGSFTVDPRLQRHFAVFAVNFPEPDSLKRIVTSILEGHFNAREFPHINKLVPKLTAAILDLHKKITTFFLPTAIKFHYQFNLREVAQVMAGLQQARPEVMRQPMQVVRLWKHESERVYADRLVAQDEKVLYNVQVDQAMEAAFSDLDRTQRAALPLIISPFASGMGQKVYNEIPEGFTGLKRILEDSLASYNDSNPAMNLVLFEDAMAHVCRISRIIDRPRGNALLVGVGGSGKQSLARLSAFIAGYDVFQITITSTYGVEDFKADLKKLYMKAGLSATDTNTVFLFTDTQITDERFLVYINDTLSTGLIPDLFETEDKDLIINTIRPRVKGASIPDTRENCLDFFIEKVRANLHVVLCFSPVGDLFRQRARKFPALFSCTSIDWFHGWPQEALLSVAARFLAEVELGGEEISANVVKFMAHAHGLVNEMSKEFLATDRRYNYTTPKSYLELISLYKSMLAKKRLEIEQKIDRFESGLIKLEDTGKRVDELKATLEREQRIVEDREQKANELLERVGKERAIVEQEQAGARVEEENSTRIEAEVTVQEKSCSEDLAAAEPAMLRAQKALDTLNKANLTELKSLPSPPADVAAVAAATMILLSPPSGVVKDTSWGAAKKMMNQVDRFLELLKVGFDKDHIPQANLRALEPYLSRPDFNGEDISRKSVAAAGLCEWVKNIVAYFNIYCDVQPKRERLAAAREQLEAARQKLETVQKRVAALNKKLKALVDQFEQATAEKNSVIAAAEKTKQKLVLANRLVNGLASEAVRWKDSVAVYRHSEATLVGDVLLCAAFLSYIGPFTKRYRIRLLSEWTDFIKKNKIPISDDLDPLNLLTDDATKAQWNNEKLPTDRLSIENAVIVTNCERWPLIIDPQLQGITWIKTKEGERLRTTRLTQPKYLKLMEDSLGDGRPILIENIQEIVDAVLDPVMGRNIFTKGKVSKIKLGDKTIDYDPKFKLFLQTKLSNPHYRPEIQAQTTLVNFTVTEEGLEDQLLGHVVKREKPELERAKADLMTQQNDFKIKLKELEDSLLANLTAATGDILSNVELIEQLEKTKITANEIQEKVKEAKITEANLNQVRESYRPVAARAALLYFLVNDLWKIDHMYQFSLNAFLVVFYKAMDLAPQDDDLAVRAASLIDGITYQVYAYVNRGLFVKHKLIFTTQLSLRVLRKSNLLDPEQMDYLIRGKKLYGQSSPVDWLTESNWAAVWALKELPGFKQLPSDIEGSQKRWKEWCDHETPEKEKPPQEWRNKSTFERLLIIRALRPDRMMYAVQAWICEAMGSQYVDPKPIPLDQSFEETHPQTPMFFVLSPGVDPVKEVEALGRKLGFTADKGKFKFVSLGQGQEPVAEEGLENAYKNGTWIMLENCHLMSKWLAVLEKKLEMFNEGSHPDARVFLSAEPTMDPVRLIPQGILQNCIKVTNEPPRGLKANMRRAFACFDSDTLEMCTKQNEFKSILFALCFFHGVILERRKFGPQGWNVNYNFNLGDLTISVSVLFNYLETNQKIPWEDLRYIFGEIMYGGHISDDWDRRLCKTYLQVLMQEELFNDLELGPGFPAPHPGNYEDYKTYIEESLPPETPYMFGLHPNAEIGFLTEQAEGLFKTILELQPKDGADAGGISRDEKVNKQIDDIQAIIPDNFEMAELYARVQERTPYTSVCLQECDRMNILLNELRNSLKELKLGLKGDLSMSQSMEDLMSALFIDRVPNSWAKKAYPSLKGLPAWLANLQERLRQLQEWSMDLNLPKAVWLSGLFNPQAFLTAIMQSTARKNQWPLDKMCLQTDITKKTLDEISSAPREGAYVYGLFLEGARLDPKTGYLAESQLKELHPQVPIIFVKAVTLDKRETKDIYHCPLYMTRRRGPTFVWEFTLKTRLPESKWILAGVALLLSAE